MLMHQKNHIKAGERFNPDSCPMVTSQVDTLQKELAEFRKKTKRIL